MKAVCSDRRLALWRVSRHFKEPGLPPCMHLHITRACQCAWGSAVQQQQCAPQRLTEVQREDGVYLPAGCSSVHTFAYTLSCVCSSFLRRHRGRAIKTLGGSMVTEPQECAHLPQTQQRLASGRA